LAAASLAHALAAAGQKDEARAILEKLKAASTERYVSAFALAVAYLGLGEQEAAMEHLEKAREERSTRMVYLPIDPRFDPLRGQPRFEELVRSVQLERPSVSSGTG
jgi:tetratricopeptide (TPR) repeat protein